MDLRCAKLRDTMSRGLYNSTIGHRCHATLRECGIVFLKPTHSWITTNLYGDSRNVLCILLTKIFKQDKEKINYIYKVCFLKRFIVYVYFLEERHSYKNSNIEMAIESSEFYIKVQSAIHLLKKVKTVKSSFSILKLILGENHKKLGHQATRGWEWLKVYSVKCMP